MKTPTPEEIAAANEYWSSREGLAETMARRAKQLHDLIRLKAPELIIEGSRQLMFTSLMTFPVNEEARLAEISMNQSIKNDEFKALEAAGYYKEHHDQP